MKNFTVFFFLLFFAAKSISQDTFSIVALDTITGEVGSAGASCLDGNQIAGGAIIISDLLPGRGAIHTQSYWLPANQANARIRMEEGLSPQEIVNWLKTNDAEGGIAWLKRQYGVVDFDPQGHPRSAALTGLSCLDYKGHRLGLNYAIQGNILLGPQILDSMEARFLSATGSLSDRLMACLQGANVPGADSRCLNNGVSSLSAFLRVAKPGDADDSLSLDLNVPTLPAGMEPIDSLQRLYNQWKASVSIKEPALESPRIFPNPASGWISIVLHEAVGLIQIFDLTGRCAFSKALEKGENRLMPILPNGIYSIKISASGKTLSTRKLVWQP